MWQPGVPSCPRRVSRFRVAGPAGGSSAVSPRRYVPGLPGFPAPGAKPSRTIYHLDIFVPNQQKDLPRRFCFSERSRKCIVARARPHFLRRRVRVSKAFTAALDHRPVPSDNVCTSRPLHPCPVPGIPKRPIANTFSALHAARSPNEPEQSNHVHRAHLHRPDPRLSQDPRR